MSQPITGCCNWGQALARILSLLHTSQLFRVIVHWHGLDVRHIWNDMRQNERVYDGDSDWHDDTWHSCWADPRLKHRGPRGKCEFRGRIKEQGEMVLVSRGRGRKVRKYNMLYTDSHVLGDIAYKRFHLLQSMLPFCGLFVCLSCSCIVLKRQPLRQPHVAPRSRWNLANIGHPFLPNSAPQWPIPCWLGVGDIWWQLWPNG